MSTEGQGAPPAEDEVAGAGRASRRIESILAAAEAAADQMRVDAERRSAERIAEATRAAENRVNAAEAEAQDILADAQRRAATLHSTAEADAVRIREQATAQASRVVDRAQSEATETQRIAEVFAAETREAASRDAREEVRKAREMAAEILEEGTELSNNLRALGDSLHANADRLLKDVASAHRSFLGMLDRAGYSEPANGSTPRASPSLPRADFGEIPEFIPQRPRRQG